MVCKECGEPGVARELCAAHYSRFLRHGNPQGGGPGRRSSRHRSGPQRRPGQTECDVGDCTDPVFGRIWCAYHYNRWLRNGDPEGGPRRRSRRRRPGERVKYSDGYVRVHGIDHPNARNGIVLEHVLVMAEQLGRPIHDEETVHHRNGIKHDNAPSNLELWASRHPRGQRVEDLVAFAREILDTYGNEF